MTTLIRVRMARAMITNKTSFGRIAWFSGGTKGRLVVADRVQRKDYRKLTASEGGGGGLLEYDIA